ncbi:MAG: winged helix-turn-helix transcriptional regulator [Candidatus Diapherotrites archaeon]
MPLQQSDEQAQALELGARKKIYTEIKSAPGIHFRELQRRTGLATGSLQYHLDVLVKKHVVKVLKEKKFARYYTIREMIESFDAAALGILRQQSIRQIVLFLLQSKSKSANNMDIAAAVSLSPSTVSVHLDKMVGVGLLKKERRGREVIFSLSDTKRTAELLVEHKKSFFDELVDNFAEVWQQI